MDEKPQLLPLLRALLFVPFALAVMAPLAVVFVILFYASVLVRGVVQIAGSLVSRKSKDPAVPLATPHFLETPAPKVIPE